MRFWWRALHGAAVGNDIKALQQQESAVFGATEQASKVMVRVHPSELSIGQFDFRESLRYMGYGLAETREDPAHRYIAPGAKFSIELLSPDIARLKQAAAALCLLLNIGGMGARSRRGWGSLRVTTEAGADVLKFVLPLGSGIKYSLQTMLRLARGRFAPWRFRDFNKYLGRCGDDAFIGAPIGLADFRLRSSLRQLGPAQDGFGVLGYAPDDVVVTDAGQRRVTLGDELLATVAKLGPEQPVLEAHLYALQVGQSRLDAEQLVEACGAPIANVHFDHRQVDTELRPGVIVEPAPAHVLDTSDFEVGDVGAVMDDAHQIGFSKAHPYRVTGEAVRSEITFQEAREIT